MTIRTPRPKRKRLSKSQRIQRRRLKQAGRKAGLVPG